MKRFFLLILLFVICHSILPGQKILQMEKAGKVKTKRYFIGDELIYQIQGEDIWYQETIQDIYVNDNLLLFPNRVVNIDNIVAIKYYKNRGWSRALSNNAYAAGGTFIIFSLLGHLVSTTFDEGNLADRWTISQSSAIIPGSAIFFGWLIRKIFRGKKYKIGKKRRLRLIDLNFYSTLPRP